MRVVAAAVGLVALAVVTLGWLGSPDRLTATEAATVAAHAYEAAGVDEATVDPRPEAGVYISPSGDARIAVWKTVATVPGGTIQLWLSRADAESVFLDDRSADGTAQLLTDEQFTRLAEHYENPTVSRQIQRNLWLTLAAGLIVLLAVRLSVVRMPVGARRLLGLDVTRARPTLRVIEPRLDPSPVVTARVDPPPVPIADELDVLEGELDEEEEDDGDEEDGGDWELSPDLPEDVVDEWEPMWEDPEDAPTTSEGEWEPMWDDSPSGTGSVAADDVPESAPDPGSRRARLRASGRRPLHAREPR